MAGRIKTTSQEINSSKKNGHCFVAINLTADLPPTEHTDAVHIVCFRQLFSLGWWAEPGVSVIVEKIVHWDALHIKASTLECKNQSVVKLTIQIQSRTLLMMMMKMMTKHSQNDEMPSFPTQPTTRKRGEKKRRVESSADSHLLWNESYPLHLPCCVTKKKYASVVTGASLLPWQPSSVATSHNANEGLRYSIWLEGAIRFVQTSQCLSMTMSMIKLHLCWLTSFALLVHFIGKTWKRCTGDLPKRNKTMSNLFTSTWTLSIATGMYLAQMHTFAHANIQMQLKESC